MERVNFKANYATGGKELTLDVIIGEAQLGRTLVRLDGKEIARDHEIKELAITGRLAGKELVIKTVVTDVSDKTNRTSVRYVLRGGPAELAHDLNATVAEEGGSVIYNATFELQ